MYLCSRIARQEPVLHIMPHNKTPFLGLEVRRFCNHRKSIVEVVPFMTDAVSRLLVALSFRTALSAFDDVCTVFLGMALLDMFITIEPHGLNY